MRHRHPAVAKQPYIVLLEADIMFGLISRLPLVVAVPHSNALGKGFKFATALAIDHIARQQPVCEEHATDHGSQ